MKGLISLYIIVAILAIIGEIRCLYKFFSSDFEPSYRREVIYGVGAFTGLGTIVGYFDIEDTVPVGK